MEYQEYGAWLKAELGAKVQKISVNAGFTCPNRDGRVGWGGCTFCNNQTFVPEYGRPQKTITEQLEDGKRFFARKYPEMKYLAYFQAYTNTYGDVAHCISCYEEALRVPDVVGLVVGTRPDCMPDALLDYFEELNRRTFLMIEYGVESANDETLRRINRGHTFADSERAIRRTAGRGIRVGAHFILGLPGEGREELRRQASVVGELPLTTLKLHQLQIIRGTQMQKEWQEHPWPLPSVEEYVDWVIDYVTRFSVRRSEVLSEWSPCVFERFVSSSPSSLLVAPKWGLKNHEFTDLLRKRLSITCHSCR